ncbi:MAG: hypothetical protein WBP00_19190 [Saprospiraceae bacterium]
MDITYQTNKIYFIASLEGVHLDSANDLYNYHVERYFPRISNKYFVNSRQELFELLSNISNSINDKTFPLIHFECHGLSNQKGICLNNDDQIDWKELSPYLDVINVKSCNNLLIILAACNSIYIIEELIKSYIDTFDSKCPFFGFVGNESIVELETLILCFPKFYKTLSENQNLPLAVKAMNLPYPEGFKYFTCYSSFIDCVNNFSDNQIKNRAYNFTENFEAWHQYYCTIFTWTYSKNCDIEDIETIIESEKFYLDYLNKRKDVFLHVNNCHKNNDRFPDISGLENFDRSTPKKIISGQSIKYTDR